MVDDLNGLCAKAKATIAEADTAIASLVVSDRVAFSKAMGLMFKAGYEQCGADAFDLIDKLSAPIPPDQNNEPF